MTDERNRRGMCMDDAFDVTALGVKTKLVTDPGSVPPNALIVRGV